MFDEVISLAEAAMRECERLKAAHASDPRALDQIQSVNARADVLLRRAQSAAEFLAKQPANPKTPNARPQTP